MVAGIQIHQAVRSDGDACWMVKLIVGTTVRTPLAHQGAVNVEDLYALVVAVGHVDLGAVGVDVHRNPDRVFELPVGRTIAPPLAEEGAVKVEDLYAVVVVFRNVDLAARDGDVAGVCELPFVCPVASPGAEESAVGVPHADAVVVGLGDVYLPAGTDGHAGRVFQPRHVRPGLGILQVPVVLRHALGK